MIKIIGAGLTGLVAAKILEDRQPLIIERNAAIYDPNRRMRFRTPVLAQFARQPLESVLIEKGYEKWLNPVADGMSYSRKCYGISINTADLLVSTGMHQRYVSAPDLVTALATSAKIEFNTEYDFKSKQKEELVISTLPMPVLMEKLDYESSLDFRTYRTVRVRAKVKNFDAYLSLLLPSPRTIASRVILMGNELEIEIPRPELDEAGVNAWFASWGDADWMNCARRAMESIGDNQPEFIEPPVAEIDSHPKFLAVSHDERMKFMTWARNEHNIASVGKFAQWWPAVTMEDVVIQLNTIREQIANGARLN